MASFGPSEEMGVATGELDAVVQDTEFFRSLVENGSDAIVSIDQHSTILYANQSVERVFGYRPEELIGEKLTTIMPERFRGDHFESIARYIETGERELDWNDIQLPAKRRDGEEIPLSITFEEHSYEGERVFSGIMRDISDRVEREAELERQNERLERFASLVAHDLRDPLQTARATLAVAQAGDEDALDDLDAVFDRMDELIGDVLTLAKQGQTVGEAQAVDLGRVADDAWETVDTGTATLVVGDDLPAVMADRERARTLFENLFKNGVEHGSTGDGVTIRVEPLADGHGVAVADDGPGFGDTDTDRLFDYGYTTSDDGTGFGLSIVDEVARAHGWAVTATTGADGGARFEVETR
ncbi:PAS domain S-box protein [Haloplanus salinus]|jgi:PAS domain S-box-containing protein|uniref:histidine kinase n=1 Tax=Haloplanus salinus TaxID=1126245 RepID=A0A368NCX7_9EURY|nr:PAS domain-containing sensor histidine kinase [Haloplanus salinus]RCU47159.1 PAS domain S-box protein [Haloplanus salinus]